ncbi:MAG: SNF2-related protein, partial [Polyangiaceae bacterium]|nr:SNF2-related protein [Polyangiaceae bacterium]
MNDESIKQLVDTIRRHCSPAVWSEAVSLTRNKAVIGEYADDDGVQLLVTIDNGLRSCRVNLWPEEEEWCCDCGGSNRACAHSAAAAIALNQARKTGKAMPESFTPKGRIGYRLRRTKGGLLFDRVVVTKLGEEPIRSSLTSIAMGRTSGPKFVAEPADHQVERVLTSRMTGLFLKHEIEPLLEALVDCADVTLDGSPVKVSKSQSPVHVAVENCAAGFRLTAIQDPDIDEVFDNGVVRCGNELRPLGEPGLTARELEEFRKGLIVPIHEIARLASEVLPSLRSRVTVHMRAMNLPSLDAEVLPRISIQSTKVDDELVLLASIVYGDPPTARVDGDTLTHLRGQIPVRRIEMEQRLLRMLETEYGIAPGVRTRVSVDRGLQLAALLKRSVKNVSVVGDGHASFFRAGELAANVEVLGDDFDLTFETMGGGHATTFAVFRAWRTGESMVPLLEGGWATIPKNFLDTHGQLLADLLAARAQSETKHLPVAAIPNLAKLCELLGVKAPPSFDRLKPLIDNFDGIPEAPLPENLQAELRPYQRVGVNWLHFLRKAGLGALLADDMGLGKTLQALCVIEGKTLVVAPTSVVHNWAREIERFRPGLNYSLYTGPKRAIDPNADVTITNYAILRIDSAKLTRIEWDTLVLDEAQSIKNSDSQVAHAAYGIKAAFRIAMTGTPIENRLEELWSQFHAVNRGLLGDRADFRDRVVRPILDGSLEAVAKLRERIRPFVLRRRKSDVAPELPPRTDTVLRCELDDNERALYESIRGAMIPAIVDKLRSGGNVMEALEALLRLRQAACHQGLVPGHHAESS